MTTSTPRAEPVAASAVSPAPPASPRAGRRRRAAFTLTEVLIASALSSIVLAGVLSTFLLVGRTGLYASAYADLSTRLRFASERFDRDVRLASDVRWQSERRLTLVFSAGPEVTYAFEPAADPSAPGRFTRQAKDAAAEVLVRDVSPDFTFLRYRLPSASGEDAPARNDLETKQLELRIRALRPAALSPSANQLALSARCVLRNKNSGA